MLRTTAGVKVNEALAVEQCFQPGEARQLLLVRKTPLQQTVSEVEVALTRKKVLRKEQEEGGRVVSEKGFAKRAGGGR